MEDKNNKNKRKKLTLSVSGSLKKPQQKIELAKTQDKNSVFVDKKIQGSRSRELILRKIMSLIRVLQILDLKILNHLCQVKIQKKEN